MDILRNSTKEEHEEDLSLLSTKDVCDAIHSVECEKEQQQTSSTPARMPGHYNTADIPTQTEDKAHGYWTRSQVRR
jgi:hypothetical protein